MGQPAEIVEEPVKTAGDWQACDMCTCKFKGMTKLIAHQQTAHLTCNMCPKSIKWVGLSLEHLKIHHTNTHKIRTESQKCQPCKLKFPDAMAKNVHMLKHHTPQYKCTKCNITFIDKRRLDVHTQEIHTEQTTVTKIKCIVCEFKAGSEPELTKHYEENHIASSKSNSNNNAQVKCKNGLSCDFHKVGKCSFLHEEPWQKVHTKRQKVQPKIQHGQRSQLAQKQHSDQVRSACRNGPNCSFLRHNRCNFFHDQQKHHRQSHTPHKTQQREASPRQEARLPRRSVQIKDAPSKQLRQCKFGAKCDQGVNCGYLHLASDFLHLNGGRRS